MTVALAAVVCVCLVLLAAIAGSLLLARRAMAFTAEDDRCEVVVGHERCSMLAEHEGPHKVGDRWWADHEIFTPGDGRTELKRQLDEALAREFELRRELSSLRGNAASAQEARVRAAFGPAPWRDPLVNAAAQSPTGVMLAQANAAAQQAAADVRELYPSHEEASKVVLGGAP